MNPNQSILRPRHVAVLVGGTAAVSWYFAKRGQQYYEDIESQRGALPAPPVRHIKSMRSVATHRALPLLPRLIERGRCRGGVLTLPTWNPPSRAEQLRALQTGDFDVLVVGGGATGSGSINAFPICPAPHASGSPDLLLPTHGRRRDGLRAARTEGRHGGAR